jgi:3-deoxy-D-arabino-heptulosonate 7-phosphate (DAHP) synthase class II
MKNLLIQDGQGDYARPSPQQLETGGDSEMDVSYGDAFQGIEFLDDAIRMEDQTLDTNEPLSPVADVARRPEIN